MKSQQALIKVLFGYISFAFAMVLLDIFFFHPFPNVVAAGSLLTAAYYVGRYSKTKQ